MKEFKEHPFVASLERLRDEKNRAALARLRRGLGKRMGTPEMFPYVVPYLPDSGRGQERFFLIASLFALHPAESSRGVSIGAALKQMERSESIEKRFTNLLAADPADIGGYLRHVVSLAKSQKVPIDYHRLFYDLLYWDHPDRFVQLAWARDFWGFEKSMNQKNDMKGENA